MKLSKKLTKDLEETLKEPDGLYVWISIKDAEEILKLIKSNALYHELLSVSMKELIRGTGIIRTEVRRAYEHTISRNEKLIMRIAKELNHKP